MIGNRCEMRPDISRYQAISSFSLVHSSSQPVLEGNGCVVRKLRIGLVTPPRLLRKATTARSSSAHVCLCLRVTLRITRFKDASKRRVVIRL